MVLKRGVKILDLTNVIIILVFILLVVLISLILSKYSINIQGVVLTMLAVISFICDRLMLHYFHEYCEKQWYYLNITKIRGSIRESIIVPFILIGMIVYWLTQNIVMKIEKK